MDDNKIAEIDKNLESIQIKEINADQEYIDLKKENIQNIDESIFAEKIHDNENILQFGVLQRLRYSNPML